MLITLDINLETGSAKILEIVKDTVSSNPEIIVEKNKLVLNKIAREVLAISPGEELVINYEQSSDGFVPIIAKAEYFGTKGNKLTKSGTVSYKGGQRDVLVNYGETFILKEKQNGCFYMLNPARQIVEEAIEDPLNEFMNIDENAEVDKQEVNFNLGETDKFDIDFDNLQF